MPPFIYDPNLDPNNNANQVQLSGGSTVANAPAATGAPAQSKDVKSGSGFQNLDKYFQGGQAQQFGGQFLGKVGEQVQGAQTQMNQAGDQFRSLVEAGGKTPTEAQIQQAVANPTAADVNQFKDWRTQTYTGPKSLSDTSAQDAWNKYWSGTKQAQTNAGLLGNEAGRFTLLDQYYKKPTYTMGQKSLDNLFIQGAGLGGQTRDIQNQAAQLQTQANTGQAALEKLAADKAAAVEASRNQALAAIGVDAQGNVLTGANAGALGQQYQSIDQAVAAENARRNQLIQNFQAGTITPADAERLGLSAYQATYNVDPTQFIRTNLSRSEVMTPDQQARIQALSQLAGVNDTFAANPLSDASINVGGLQGALAAGQAQYQKAIQSEPVIQISSGPYGPGVGTGFMGKGAAGTEPISIAEAEQQLQAAKQGVANGRGTTMFGDYSKLIPVMEQQLNAAKVALAKKYGAPSTGAEATAVRELPYSPVYGMLSR